MISSIYNPDIIEVVYANIKRKKYSVVGFMLPFHRPITHFVFSYFVCDILSKNTSIVLVLR